MQHDNLTPVIDFRAIGRRMPRYKPSADSKTYETLPDGSVAIHCRSGLRVVVDAADAERLRQFSIYPKKSGGVTRAVAMINGRRVSLPRWLLGANSQDAVVDHINGDTLDNRRGNLRICTHVQNSHNAKKRSGDAITSRYIGVTFQKRRGKFIARIHHGGRFLYLGAFIREEDAARAYDAKAKELRGEFARLNFAA